MNSEKSVVDKLLPLAVSNDMPGPSNVNRETPAYADQSNEFEGLGILTQFIRKIPEPTAIKNPTLSSITLLTEEFKDEYTELIDIMDRANAHLKLLKAAKLKGRMPLKL